MQIGIDVGATKIEYILLHDNGEETGRSRIDCPKDYNSIIHHIKNSKLPSSLNKFFKKKDVHKIVSFMLSDKKNKSDKINLIVLKRIGLPVINKEYKKNEILKFLKDELNN